MNNRYKITYYPSALTRQHSYLSLHNFSNNTTKDFHYLSTLGEGTYGYVRLFAHEDEKIAVKSLKVKHSTNLDKKTVAQNKREIISEYHFLQRAHQYGECYSLQHFEEALPLSKRNVKRNSRLYNYTYRMTMPYIEGMNPGKFATTYITNPKDMAH
jgi:serine/threonine protein kinase